MATEVLFLSSYASLPGVLLLKAFLPGSDTIVESQTATYGANNPSEYSATFIGLGGTQHKVVLFADGTPAADAFITTLNEDGDRFADCGRTTSVSSGARTVLVTVDDGTNPLENALVRMTNGAETYTLYTDVNGQATFNLDDATWTVGITKANYLFSGTTLVVDGAKTPTYSMSIVAAATLPSDPAQSTGVIRCYDEEGVAKPAVTVSVVIQHGPGTAGLAYNNATWSVVSDGNGDASFVGLVRGAHYRAYRGTETVDTEYFEFQVPDRSSFLIMEMVGTE